MPDAIRAHEIALTRGGRPGFIDRGLVESAIARPYCGYYPKIQQKTAALIESGCRNHGFVDGNKRMTVILMLLLLEQSGYTLEALEGESLEQAIEDMAIAVANTKGRMTFKEIESWVTARLKKKPAK